MAPEPTPDRPDDAASGDPLAALRRHPAPSGPTRALPAWLDDPSRRSLAFGGLGAVVVVLVAAGVVWWARSGGAPTASPGAAPALFSPATTAPSAPASPGGGPSGTAVATVVVHAAGAVAQPGVYRLPAGARVDDALRAAGGPTADADLDRVNLAGPLSDGARVYVPHLGEQSPPELVDPDAVAGDRSASGGAAAPAGPGPDHPVDLNRAGLDELDELPGVGPSTASAIVAYREQHGPFRRVDDLLAVRGIGPAKLEQLRPLVRVGG